MIETRGVDEMSKRGGPTRVITSLEPELTKTAGRRVIVIETPTSEVRCFDRVICKKIRELRG
jgi:hypothetical protein